MKMPSVIVRDNLDGNTSFVGHVGLGSYQGRLISLLES